MPKVTEQYYYKQYTHPKLKYVTSFFMKYTSRNNFYFFTISNSYIM